MVGETCDYTFCRQWLTESAITIFSARRAPSHCDILFAASGVQEIVQGADLDWVKQGSRYRPSNFKATAIFPWKLSRLPLYESTRLGLFRFIGGQLGVFLILLAVLMGAIKCLTADLPPVVFHHLVASRSHPDTRTNIHFNMSTFLFYKPNSNPNRYSRSERFSKSHIVSNSDNSLNHRRRSPSPKESALPEDVHSNDDNRHCLNTHQAAADRSVYMRADSILSSGMSDSCGESIQDDIESLHGLFSEPATGSQSDFSEADGVASAGVLTRSIEDVSPAGPYDDERPSMENTSQEIRSNRSSPNLNRYHQHSKGDSPPGANFDASELTCESVYFDNVAHFSSPQPMDTPLEGSATFCAPFQSPSQPTILEKGRSSSVLKTQDGVKPSKHTSSYGKVLSGKGNPDAQFSSFHSDDKTDVPCCTSFVPDTPTCLGSAAAPPFNEGHDLQPDTCTGAASPARVGSTHLLHSLHDLAEEHLDNPRHPDVHYPETPDCVGALGPDTVPMDCVINLDELESCPPVSSPPEFNMDVQDPLQHPGVEPKDLEVLLAAVPSDGLGPDVQFQTRQELGVNRDGNSVVPVHATGVRSKDPHVAPNSPNSLGFRPCPEGYLEFSHVEIRNHRPLENTTSSIETLENVTSPSSSCCHSKETSRTWCLDGSILSIDIQNADFPIGLGKSSFHVFENQVIQILTVVHGPVEAFLSQKTAPSTKVNKKKRKFSRPAAAAAAAAPLSSEQKQYLLELRDQGHTWNDIVAKFPGRKKGTLQAIYYAKVKNLRNPTSRDQRYTGRPKSAARSSQGLSRTRGNTIGTGVSTVCQTENEVGYSRYSLRPRGVR